MSLNTVLNISYGKWMRIVSSAEKKMPFAQAEIKMIAEKVPKLH